MADTAPPSLTNGATTTTHPMLTKTLPPLLNRRNRWVLGEVGPGTAATMADVELVTPESWHALVSWWGDGQPLEYVMSVGREQGERERGRVGCFGCVIGTTTTSMPSHVFSYIAHPFLLYMRTHVCPPVPLTGPCVSVL